MAVYINTSKRVVYLSRAGVQANVPCSSLLQSILDYGGGMPLRVVNDVIGGPVVADGLQYWSNTEIETLGGAQWQKQGYDGITPGLGKPMFRNKYPTAGPAAPVDSNVHFRGGRWDANRRGKSAGGTTAYWTGRSLPQYIAFANNQDEVVPLLGFYGVDHFSALDLDFYDLACYGVHTSNANDFWVQNIRKRLHPGDTFAGDNAVQSEGYCTHGRVSGVVGEANDDLCALNANDGHDIYGSGSPVTFPSYIASGPCSDISYDSIELTGGSSNGAILRLLFANTTGKGLSVRNCKNRSSAALKAVFISNFSIPGTSVIEDLHVSGLSGIVPSDGLFHCDNANLTVRRLVLDALGGSGSGTSKLVAWASGTCSSLTLTNSHGTSVQNLLAITGGGITELHRGTYAVSGLSSDVLDSGSRITTIRRG